MDNGFNLEIRPKENPYLKGHEDIEKDILDLWSRDKLPHALILSGNKGIGKATLGYKIARFLLSQENKNALIPPDSLNTDILNPISQQIIAGSHPDFLGIERQYDAVKKKYRSEIVVDDIRKMNEFVHLTSSYGGWRVLLVDDADLMNRNAANALLKVLEEPPQSTLIILICHSISRLLPTIRSRCWHISMTPLDTQIINEVITYAHPELNDQDQDILVSYAEGSLGKVKQFPVGTGIELYKLIQTFFEAIERKDKSNENKIVSQIIKKIEKGDNEYYQLFQDLYLHIFENEILRISKNNIENSNNKRKKITDWFNARDRINDLFRDAENLYFDFKLTTINILNTTLSLG